MGGLRREDWLLDAYLNLIFGFKILISIHFDSALRLGLPFVPSYLGQTSSIDDMIQGVNYASAGSGIIFSSGSELVHFP